jgi:hypothetical protein
MNQWLLAIGLALTSCGASSDSVTRGGTGGMASLDSRSGSDAGDVKDDGIHPADTTVDTPAPADRFTPSDTGDVTGGDAHADGATVVVDARPDGIPTPPNPAPPCDPAMKVANGAPCQSQGVVFSCRLQSEAGPALLCICARILDDRWACAPGDGVIMVAVTGSR